QWRLRTAHPPVKLSTRAARYGAVACLLGIAILLWPLGRGYLDGQAAIPDLAARADALIATGRGPDDLGPGRWDTLVRGQDLAPGAIGATDRRTGDGGLSAVTQSLAAQEDPAAGEPGWARLRHMGVALGYGAGLSEDQIGALWLDRVEMVRVTRGGDVVRTVGFWTAADRAYAKAPAALAEAEFSDLILWLIVPPQASNDQAAQIERAARIARYLDGACLPRDADDVRLDGCAAGR
ncbi:MAG: hypothetical protein AAGK57_08040, partial [Pseudomonadota bacterium]